MEKNSFYVSVRSYVENLDDFGLTESTESDVATAPCELLVRGGVARISYKTENDGVVTETEITASERGVKLVRRGGIESVMEFSEGRITKTLYRIPPYAFDAEIDTKRVRNTLCSGGGTLELLYLLSIGGAKKKMKLSLTVGHGA